MIQFKDWCDYNDTPVGDHYIRVTTGRGARNRRPGYSKSAARSLRRRGTHLESACKDG